MCELPSRTRSAVTNHKHLLPGLDGRSATARRFRDLVNAFVADMGGLDRCSEIRLGLVRRLAATTVQAEMLEARMVNGEAIDIATLCTLASTTVRLSQRLGLERRARNVSERHRRRATEPRDKSAPPHSITSSARAINDGGTTTPINLAVLKLMASSNFTGCTTGNSEGELPLRILPA